MYIDDQKQKFEAPINQPYFPINMWDKNNCTLFFYLTRGERDLMDRKGQINGKMLRFGILTKMIVNYCHCCFFSGWNGRMNAEFICHILSDAVTLASIALLNAKTRAAP